MLWARTEWELNVRVVVTGGLTGGHVFPCITLALALSDLGHQVRYVGGAGELEEAMAARYGVDFEGFDYVRAPTIHRTVSILRGAAKIYASLRSWRPNVVFCKGSPTGVPAALAGRAMGVPIVLHESDSVPGSEMRWLAPLSQVICVGYPSTASHFKRRVLITGNLIRPNFGGGSRETCLRRYGLPTDRPVVTIIGGSQGATSLNAIVRAIVPALVSSCSLIHLCGVGKRDGSLSRTGYVSLEFVNDEIRDIYAATDLLVSRAGAGVIEEACAYRVPALYVPYPWAQYAHQENNARIMSASGVAEVELQQDLTPAKLLSRIRELLSRKDDYMARYDRLQRPRALPSVRDAVLREARGVDDARDRAYVGDILRRLDAAAADFRLDGEDLIPP